MKFIFAMLFLAVLLTSNCFAQSQFQLKTNGTVDDDAYSIVKSLDEGYAIAGFTSSFGAGSSNVYIMKLNATGSLQWSRTVGGTSEDRAYSLIPALDAGYAVVGYTWSYSAGYNDMYIIKISSEGLLQWSKAIGGLYYDQAYSIVQTTDSGYTVAGYTTSFGAGGSDMYILKLSSNGSLLWSKTIGGTNSDQAYSIAKTTDGGCIIAGNTNSFGVGGIDMFIVKIDSTGSLQWSKTVGGIGNDEANSIIQTKEGGYAVSGITNSFGVNGDMYIVKLDASGSLQWSKVIGGTNTESAISIIQTFDGGYASVGFTYWGSPPGNYDMYIIKLTESGSLQWSETLAGSRYDIANSIVQTSDSGYVAAGYSALFGAGNNNMYIVKFDKNGNTCGNSTFISSSTGSGGTMTTPIPTVTAPNPTASTPPSIVSSGGSVSTVCITGIDPISNSVPDHFSLHQNYPNPFNPSTMIEFDISKLTAAKITVYDALGRQMEELINEQLKPGSYKVNFNGSKLASGVYYYKLSTDNYSSTKKLLLLK